jgi:fructokinase
MRIGVDLGGTKIEAISIDTAGATLARRRIDTPRGDYPGTLRAIAGLVAALETETGSRGTVGVGTPGALSPFTGRMRNANSTWLNGRALGQDLTSALGRPIRLANDADCFALSEATDGAAAGARSVFGVIIGTGTGAGVVVDGRLLSGPNAIAGEWGHNPLPWPAADELPGPACYCGKHGCIETFVSGPGIAADFTRTAGGSMSAAEIAAAAQAGDATACAALGRHADRLARGLAGVINILDPDVIVLGGGLSNLAHLYATVPTLLGRYLFSDGVATRLVPPQHGDSSGVRGAAWLWSDPARCHASASP